MPKNFPICGGISKSDLTNTANKPKKKNMTGGCIIFSNNVFKSMSKNLEIVIKLVSVRA